MNHRANHFIYFILFIMVIDNITACKTSSLQEQSLEELKQVLHSQPEFIKVHAAEYLIWSGHGEEVRKEFLREHELHGGQPKYRIGIWRVLAQTEVDPEKRNLWHEKVLKAFGDIDGPDRLHAAETLAKLRISPLEKYPDATQKSVTDTNRNMQVYTHWALSYAPNADTNKFRHDFLHMLASDTNKIVRMISAYIVRRIKSLTPGEWTKLSMQALEEPDSSDLKNNLLNTALVTFPAGLNKPLAYEKIKEAAKANYQHFSADKRIQLAQALAETGDESDIPLLQSYLNNEDIAGFYDADTKEAADVRAAAAFAILKIKTEHNQ